MLGQRKAQRMESLLGLAAIVAVLCVHQAYLTAVHPAVPYMDTLRLLTQQQAWLDGRLSLYAIWGGTAHRGLLFQFLLLANTKLFGLDAMLANRATGVVAALLSVLIATAFLRDRASDPRPLPRAAVVGIVALFAVLLSSWAGFETLLLELGLGLWLKNLAFVAYFLALDRFLREDEPSLWSALGLAIGGIVIVLLVAMGWAYAFVGAAWATQALSWWSKGRQSRTDLRRLLPPVALLIAILVYTFAGASISGGVRPSQVAAATRLLQPLYAIGSTWVGSEPFGHRFDIDWMLAAGIATTLVAGAGLAARWRRGMHSGSLLPVALLAYGALMAVSVSIARGGVGTPAVMASRYYMDLVLFLVGATWLAFEALARGEGRRKAAAMACTLLAIFVVVGQFWTYRTEWRIAPFRAHAYQAMAEALLEGADTPEDASLLQSPQPFPAQSAAIMRAHRLSLFNDAPVGRCAPEAIRWTSGWHAAERAGRWMGDQGVVALPPCRCPAVFDLFLPSSFAPRTVAAVPTLAAAAPRQDFELMPGGNTSIHVAAGQTVSLDVSRVTVPSRDLPGNTDQRTLGLLVTRVRFDCTMGKSP